jgi:hypothetical protein
VLDNVVTPAIKASLRLHQAHLAAEGIDDVESLWEALCRYEAELVICREDSPQWREAITRHPPVKQLLSFRKQRDLQAGDIFFVVLLTLHNQPFTLTRLNRECVRGFWAGQQQELVYLGSTDSERGSIQQLTTVLRNIINQACDPPVGYPVFVSEVATSYTRFWPDVFEGVSLPRFVRRVLGWPSTKNGAEDDDDGDDRTRSPGSEIEMATPV